MELAKIESTELDKVVINSGLAIKEGEEIKQSYIPFIVQLAEIQEQAKKIDFENPQNIDETIARELRLKTVKIRTGASDLKDERKKIFLLKGNLEQAAFNLIASSCKLAEETFVQVEKAREIKEKKAKEERKLKRIEILTSLEFDFTFVDILNMPDEQFDKLVLQLENERDAKIQAAIQIEKERLEKLEAERIENERIRIENEKLRAANEAKEKELAKQREVQRIASEKAANELRVANEAKEKLQREIEAKKQAEIKAQKEAELKAENERKSKELEAKKASKAPDRIKLLKWIESFESLTNLDTNISDESKLIADEIQQKFINFKIWAKQQVEKL
jgi:hypothetical protein